MTKNRENEVFINPSLRRPSALRSMLPVLLSKRIQIIAATKTVYTHHIEKENEKSS